MKVWASIPVVIVCSIVVAIVFSPPDPSTYLLYLSVVLGLGLGSFALGRASR